MAKPLVTFAQMGYNQEHFIRDAITAALSQTYEPLEIILSDDCSEDRTFETMQEMAAAYRGPHKIVLNRNMKNMGISGHENRLMEFARGDLIIIANGDDISEVNRAKVLAEYWIAHDRFVGSIYSAELVIDHNGKPLYPAGEPPARYESLRDAVWNGCQGIHGATHAFHRDTFCKFGPFIKGHMVAEDRAFSLRARTVGEIHYIDQRLVRYRVHTDNCYSARDPREAGQISSQDIRKKYVKSLQAELDWQNQFRVDLEKLWELGTCPETELTTAQQAVQTKIKLLESYLDFENESWAGKIRFAIKNLESGKSDVSTGVRFIVRALFPFLEMLNRRRLLRKGERERLKREAWGANLSGNTLNG